MSIATRPSRQAEKTGSPKIGTVAERLLSQSQSAREVVQESCPLGASLELELGGQYFRSRGSKAFLSDSMPVPFIINNDGTLSRNAAHLFFESLAAADESSELEREISVLELGMGVGLFARFFLDCFRELCLKHDKDYYDRLCYIAGDNSERILLDLVRHGVFANHPGRYRLRIVDAMQAEKHLLDEVGFLQHGNKEQPFRAVFLNYVLDCLPVAVLQFEQDQVKQLCVRTCVARNINLADFTDMSVEQLQAKAKSSNQRDKEELLEVYGLFASEYDYRPVDVKTIPYGEFGYEYGRRSAKRLLLNHGAIQSLERLLGIVQEGGFILINDYGQTQMTFDDEFEHQRFSLATAVGLNFPLLKAYFADGPKCEWVEPFGEAGGIHSRLLGRKLDRETRGCFQDRFGKPAYDRRQQPLEKARQCVQVGRFEMAAGLYNQALKEQPNNWVLLNEISTFLTFQLRDPKAGIDMAKLALALNPTCSADLWSTLGDGLYEFGRTAEARSAYLQALEVNESDVRARFNLAWVHTREKNYPAALDMIAQALALDKTGAYRDRLLQKQQEVLAHLTARNQQEYLLLINLVSKFAKKEEKPEAEKAD